MGVFMRFKGLFFTVFGLVFLSTTSFSQENTKIYSGVKKISPEAYLKIEQAKLARSFSGEGETYYKNLPSKVDLAASLPRAGDQGNQNSCTAWAVAYAVKSMQENREMGWGLTPNHLFSPAFVYNQTNEGTDDGAYLEDAVKLLQSEGAVPLELMPYDEKDFTTKPNASLKKLASSFKALGYRRLDEKDVNLIKAYLASGEPVVLILDLYPSFFPKELAKSGNIYSKANGENMGGHAVVAVGYDDAKKAIKILNSWGAGWGESGFGWVDEKFFAQVVSEAYVIYDTPTPASIAQAIAQAHPQVKGEVETPAEKPAENPKENTPVVPVKNEDKKTEPVVAVPATQTGLPLLLVPGEAGVTINGKWLRLGDDMAQVAGYFSDKTAPSLKDFHVGSSLGSKGDGITVDGSFLDQKKVGTIRVMGDSKIKVFTNEGIAIGMGKKDVRRIYKEPDVVDSDFNTDSYFYHAISQEWGGVRFTTNVTLVFNYQGDRVSFITLSQRVKSSVQKKGLVGVSQAQTNAIQKAGETKEEASAAAQKTVAVANAPIDIPEGKIKVTFPVNLALVEKSVWPGTGLGYFAKKSADDSTTMIVFKVFTSDTPVDDKKFEERITHDLATQWVNATQFQKSQYAGIDWRSYDVGPAKRLMYAYKGNVIYQILILTGDETMEAAWVSAFLNSMVGY